MASLDKRGRNYFVRFRDHLGVQRTIKAGPDKSAAEQIRRDKESELCKIKAGSLDPREAKWVDSERRPVLEHVREWSRYLLSKGCIPRHAQQSCERVVKLVGFARITRISGISIGPIQTALADIRQTRGRKGRQRLSDNSLVAYARAAKSFSRWLWRDGRAREDGLMHMAMPEVSDKTDRRALEPEEAALLISHTRSEPKRSGMTGEDRSILYSVALGTGFRLGEILSLVPESFRLDQEPPAIVCQAEHTKNGREAIQPILPELAELLRPWLARKPAGVPVLSVRRDVAARVLRQDLEAAGVEEAEAYDFHCLRHSYITMVVKSGASVKVCQELARHSDPKLTMNIYTHLTIHDTAKGLAGLVRTLGVNFVQNGATGTDSARTISSISSHQTESAHPDNLTTPKSVDFARLLPGLLACRLVQ
jgi:integrase